MSSITATTSDVQDGYNPPTDFPMSFPIDNKTTQIASGVWWTGLLSSSFSQHIPLASGEVWNE